MAIDNEISLKSLLFITESLEELLGQHGAQAVLRSAGQRAAVNLIEMLPLTLPEDEAARRSGAILAELGFIGEMRMTAPDTLQVFGNHFLEELEALNLTGSQSGRFYVIGLFEGFSKQLSGSNRKIITVEINENCEYWKLG